MQFSWGASALQHEVWLGRLDVEYEDKAQHRLCSPSPPPDLGCGRIWPCLDHWSQKEDVVLGLRRICIMLLGWETMDNVQVMFGFLPR